MVRQNMSLRQAAMELDIPLTSDECDKILKRKAFQNVLWAERHTFNAELAAQPGRNKTSAIGLMVFLIQKLIDDGEYDKALDGVQKLAKLEGWDKSAEINIIAGLTAKDLAEAKAELLEIVRKSPGKELNSSSKPN